MADKIWIHDRVKSLISLNFPSIFLFLFSFLRVFIYRDDRPCYERSNTAWESVHYLSCSGWSRGGGVRGGSRTKFSYITENRSRTYPIPPPRQTKVSLGPPWKKFINLNMQSVLRGQSKIGHWHCSRKELSGWFKYTNMHAQKHIYHIIFTATR